MAQTDGQIGLSKERDATFTRALFGDIAADYERAIVPAFRQFAAGVIHTAALTPPAEVLDIGTGTGILARLLAPLGYAVLGIDLAPQMIDIARAQADAEGLRNARFEVADANTLPYPEARFDAVVSSFGLNATTPSDVLPGVWRVLRPGGVFAFHEWHIQHTYDSRISDILAHYMLPDEDVSAACFALRERLVAPRPWDNVFQTAEDYAEELGAAGFVDVQIYEDAAVVCRLSVMDFLAYKLAWKPRRAELAEMPAFQRADCQDALHRALADEADSDGMLHYAPTLFRVRARKQG
ncbi:MAG: class I SAM-dependent methyltransferase [Anaerolineales bacterium]